MGVEQVFYDAFLRAKAYKKKWDEFLKANNYKGYGDGYVNLKKMYDDNKESISEGFFAVNKSSKSKVTDEEMKACTGVIDDHINNMPEIIFGTKDLKVKNMDYELVVKTSTGVSDVLQGIANTTNIAKRSITGRIHRCSRGTR